MSLLNNRGDSCSPSDVHGSPRRLDILRPRRARVLRAIGSRRRRHGQLDRGFKPPLRSPRCYGRTESRLVIRRRRQSSTPREFATTSASDLSLKHLRRRADRYCVVRATDCIFYRGRITSTSRLGDKLPTIQVICIDYGFSEDIKLANIFLPLSEHGYIPKCLSVLRPMISYLRSKLSYLRHILLYPRPMLPYLILIIISKTNV